MGETRADWVDAYVRGAAPPQCVGVQVRTIPLATHGTIMKMTPLSSLATQRIIMEIAPISCADLTILGPWNMQVPRIAAHVCGGAGSIPYTLNPTPYNPNPKP